MGWNHMTIQSLAFWRFKKSRLESLIGKWMNEISTKLKALFVGFGKTCLNVHTFLFKYEEIYQMLQGWKSFKVYHTWRKGLNLSCTPFLPYILIPMKNNESKVVKNFRRIIFYTITILHSIIIIHKCVFTWLKRTR